MSLCNKKALSNMRKINTIILFAFRKLFGFFFYISLGMNKIYLSYHLHQFLYADFEHAVQKILYQWLV